MDFIRGQTHPTFLENLILKYDFGPRLSYRVCRETGPRALIPLKLPRHRVDNKPVLFDINPKLLATLLHCTKKQEEITRSSGRRLTSIKFILQTVRQSSIKRLVNTRCFNRLKQNKVQMNSISQNTLPLSKTLRCLLIK